MEVTTTPDQDFNLVGLPGETCITFSVVVLNEDPELTERVWIMKLTPQGIRFNRENFPTLKEEDFAEKIIEILENHFNVKFKLRSKE